MQYIGGDLDLSFSQDCGFSCSSGGGSSSGSSSGGGGGGGGDGGEAIREGEFIALAWADIYLLNPVINKANRAVSIGGRGGSVDQYTVIAVVVVTTTAKRVSS